MVNKVISNYLKSNKRLIVPQLGAFIQKEGSGVVFVPFLKKDDGVMVSLLSAEYGMDTAEANGVIGEFIAAVRVSVAEHGCYLIDGLGAIKEDVNGTLYMDAVGAEASKMSPEIELASESVLVNKVASEGEVEHVFVPAAKVVAQSIDTVEAATVTVVESNPAPAVVSVPANDVVIKPVSLVEQPSISSCSNSGIPPTPGSSIYSKQGVVMDSIEEKPLQSRTINAKVPQQRVQEVISSQPRTLVPPVTRPMIPPQSRPMQSSQSQPQSPNSQRPAQSQQGQRPMPSSMSQGQNQRSEMSGQGDDRSAMRPSRPVRAAQNQPVKADRFMMIAIIAAVLALAAIIYGVVASKDMEPMDKMVIPATEQVQDSVSITK